MPSEAQQETDLYDLTYDSEIDTVVFRWKEFASDDRFKEGANAFLEFFRRQDTSKVINDSSGIQAHDDADQQWLLEEWVPKMLDAGMEYNVIVHKESVVSEMDVEKLVERLEDLPYELHVTTSMEEARDWIAEK